MRTEPNKFEIELTEAPLARISDVIEKARVRIFYKGRNRNGGFITDAFAEKLVQTLPYTPVKGIIDPDGGDFESHGSKSSEGKIYGIVPENPNLKWEEQLDEDGTIREYLTADVYLFTGLYESAKHIVGKGQSMELLPSSITGEWKEVNDEYLFVYHTASFLGLQVLGSEVEPAFEGAAFFSLKADELGGLLEKAYGGTDLDKEKDTQVAEEVQEIDVSVYEKQISELEADNKALAEELAELREFKANIERGEKEDILAQFSDSLGEDIAEEFRAKFDELDKVELEKELVYKQYQLEKEKAAEQPVEEEPKEDEKEDSKVEEAEEKKEEVEEEKEEEDKKKIEFSFYEVDDQKTKSATEALLEKYL